jgi:hypothetical protein
MPAVTVESVHVDAGVAGDVLRLAVLDDGVGGAEPARGSGLVGLTDPVAAIGGILSVRSRPGEGTTPLAETPGPARAKVSGYQACPGKVFLLAGPGVPDGGSGGRARTRVPSGVSVRSQIPRMSSGRPGYAQYLAQPPGRQFVYLAMAKRYLELPQTPGVEQAIAVRIP